MKPPLNCVAYLFGLLLALLFYHTLVPIQRAAIEAERKARAKPQATNVLRTASERGGSAAAK